MPPEPTFSAPATTFPISDGDSRWASITVEGGRTGTSTSGYPRIGTWPTDPSEREWVLDPDLKASYHNLLLSIPAGAKRSAIARLLSTPAISATAIPQTFIRQVHVLEPLHTAAMAEGISAYLVNLPSPTVINSRQINRAEKIRRIRDTLTRYSFFKNGWNGRGALPPSAEAILNARSFLSLIQPYDALPSPYAGEDGEVGFYWSPNDSGYAEVEFIDAQITYYARVDAAAPVEISGEHNFPGDETAIAQLIRVISQLRV